MSFDIASNIIGSNTSGGYNSTSSSSSGFGGNLIAGSGSLISPDTFQREWSSLPTVTDPAATRATASLFGLNPSGPNASQLFSYSESGPFTPGLANNFGLSGEFSDGKGFAIVNPAMISQRAGQYASSSGLGMTPGQLTSAVAANELAGRYMETDSKLEKLSDPQKELVSEAASLGATPNYAFKTLAIASELSATGHAGNYQAITDQTAETLERTIKATPGAEEALRKSMSAAGIQTNDLGEGALQMFFAHAKSTGGTIPDRFESFARDHLGITNTAAFGKAFAANMQADFTQEAKSILAGAK